MIKSFSGFRFIFALLICLNHMILAPEFGGKGLFFDTNAPLAFFFVLSGFVLTFSYYEKIQKHQFNAAFFLQKRFAKLYPTHLLALAIVLLLFAKTYTWNGETWTQLFAQIFLVHSYVPKIECYFAFNRVSWYLSTLFFLYICFAFIFPKILKARKNMLILFGLCIIWAFGMVLTAHFYKSNDDYIFSVCPLPRLLDFFLGAWLYLLYKKLQNINFSPIICTILEIIALMALPATYALNSFIHIPTKYQLCFLYLPAVSVLILVFALTDGKGIFAKIFGSKPMQNLGNISFAFYMVHLYNQSLFDLIEPFDWYLTNPVFFVSGYLLFTIAMSFVIEYFFTRKIAALILKKGK